MRKAADAALRSCIDDVKGRPTRLCFRVLYDEPEDTWIIQIAPEPGELVGGRDDGEQIFDPIDVDLLKVSACLFAFFGDNQDQRIALQIKMLPFSDMVATWVFDADRGEWREPRD